MSSTHQSGLSNRWVVLILLLGIALFNQGDRFLLTGMVELLKTEFNVSDAYMGLLMGPAFALLYSLLTIPFARAADRFSRIGIIVAGCLLWSSFTALSGLATGPWTLAAARVGVGVGEAAYQAPAYALIAAYFPVQQRGRAFAVLAISSPIGQTIGTVAGPALAATATWRFPFFVMGLSGIVAALLAFVFIKEPPRETVTAVRPPLAAVARELAKVPSYRMMMLGMAIGVLSGISFGLWGPALFERAYDLESKVASTTFGIAFGLPGVIGMLAFGLLADRGARRDPARPLHLAAAALGAATLIVFIITWAGKLETARALAIPPGLLGAGWSIGVIAALQYVLPDRVRVTGTALGMLGVNLLGFAVGPWLAGSLSSAIGGDPLQSLRLALSFVIPLGFIGSWLIWRSARSLAADRVGLAPPGSPGLQPA